MLESYMLLLKLLVNGDNIFWDNTLSFEQTTIVSKRYSSKWCNPQSNSFFRKLLGFHFIIEYKVGNENTIVDALSKRFDREHKKSKTKCNIAITTINFEFLNKLKKENGKVLELQELHKVLTNNKLPKEEYTYRMGSCYLKSCFI